MIQDFFIYHQEILYSDNVVEYKIDPISKKCWQKSVDLKSISSDYEEINFYDVFSDDIIFFKIEDMICELQESLRENKRTLFEISNSNIQSKDKSVERIETVIAKKENKIEYLNKLLTTFQDSV